MREIYLDNAATTKCYAKSAKEVEKYLTELYANPSSAHKKGFEARKIVKTTEENLLKLLGIKEKRRVIFTSGATESVNTAIKGTILKYDNPERFNVVTTTIEHPCVENTFKFLETLNVDTRYVTVDENGVINMDSLKGSVDENTKIVSIIYVNNEFGAVQDVENIIKTVRSINPETLIHVDATQAAGKLKGGLSDADFISVSAHKFHGPKGIGALILKNNLTLIPLMHGGGQQDGFRSGTINSPLIAGMNKAVEINIERFEENREALRELFNYALKTLTERFPQMAVNTPEKSAETNHILNVSFPGYRGEVILHMLEEEGIYVSVSSACSSRNTEINSILKAIGKDDETIRGTLRLSFSEMNTKEEIDLLADSLQRILKRLKLLGRKM